MDNGVLLETKTLVELIRHYIRDQMRLFSIFHACSDQLYLWFVYKAKLTLEIMKHLQV
jgi:hypothetical protein